MSRPSGAAAAAAAAEPPAPAMNSAAPAAVAAVHESVLEVSDEEAEAGRCSGGDDGGDGDGDGAVPSCTYTSSLPLDPVSSCALRDRVHSSLGIHSVSFSGCGAFYPYMYGIACFLQDHYDLSDVHFLGTSGGCLPALTLATGLDVREAFFQKWNNHVIADSAAKPLRAYFSFISTCRKHAVAYFPEDIHERANGRLHLSSSRVALAPARGWSVSNAFRALVGGLRVLQNQRTSYWSSKDDIIDSVAASTFIPILDGSGLAKRWRGELHLDGGLTDNQPILDSETIQLQPFMWRKAGIMEKASFIYIRLSPEWHAALFLKGYEHAKEHAAQAFARLPKRATVDCRPVLPADLAEKIRQRRAEKMKRQQHAHQQQQQHAHSQGHKHAYEEHHRHFAHAPHAAASSHSHSAAAADQHAAGHAEDALLV